MPESFFTCSSLITLHLIECCLVYTPVISWLSLKSIKLENMVIWDEDLVNLLSGCPALETLELKHVERFLRLNINSLRLKRLILKDYRLLYQDRADHSLEIIAPYLQHLEISGNLLDLKCRLVDVSSVLNAKLTFTNMCIKDVQDLNDDVDEYGCSDYHQVFRTLVQDYLQKLSCVTELAIGTWFTEVICMLQFKGDPLPELKCKYLTLELRITKFNLYGAASLLRASPHVETLNIDMATKHWLQSDNSLCRCFDLRYLAKGDNIDLQRISSFVFPNLKNVKIVNSSGMCLKDYLEWGNVEKLFKLSEFLLKNASVLEKFIIISKRQKCKICSISCVSRYMSRLADELVGCPRSSANSVIIFQE